MRKTRQIVALAVAGLAILALLVTVDVITLRIVRQLLIREANFQLKSMADMAAHQIDGDALAVIQGRDDMTRPEFRKLHRKMMQIRMAHPDIQYVYTMRYTGQGDQWTFVVDADPYDLDENGDGELKGKEVGTKPGDVYEAGTANALMVRGLKKVTTDMVPTDDPPWGVLVSAYAPVRNEQGEVVAILGLDMLYDSVMMKMESVWTVVVAFSALFGVLLSYAVFLYQRRTVAYDQAMHLQLQLSQVKSQFAKFVPSSVREELEQNPDASSLERTELDVTVMFADIEGYTKLSERLAGEALGGVLERYFSSYLEVIHDHEGDINETAGDGIMVIFKEGGPNDHALNAVYAAIEIEQVTQDLNRELDTEELPVRVNIGVNSGKAYLGLNRFTSQTGERYTYTATGPTTNIAARISGLAKEGDVLLSEETAQRVEEVVEVERVGRRSLKNVTNPMMIYRPCGAGRSGHIDPKLRGF